MIKARKLHQKTPYTWLQNKRTILVLSRLFTFFPETLQYAALCEKIFEVPDVYLPWLEGDVLKGLNTDPGVVIKLKSPL